MKATWLYTGVIDYWGGDGRRWDNDAGCVFAYYDRHTTLQSVIDNAAEDYLVSGDFEDSDLWEDVTVEDVHKALLDCLSSDGLKDYYDGCATVADGDLDYESDNCPVCIFLLELEP